MIDLNAIEERLNAAKFVLGSLADNEYRLIAEDIQALIDAVRERDARLAGLVEQAYKEGVLLTTWPEPSKNVLHKHWQLSTAYRLLKGENE